MTYMKKMTIITLKQNFSLRIIFEELQDVIYMVK